MSTMIDLTSQQYYCDGCGQPAMYEEAQAQVAPPLKLCDECARNRGAETNGYACAAFEAIGFAVELARTHGAVTDDQLR